MRSLRRPHGVAALCIAGIGLALLLYTAVRAVRLSITWDEAASYLTFVEPRVFILRAEHYGRLGPNHHLLNTWGMMLGAALWGPAPWALRLPALMAHVLYLYASARIALRYAPAVAVAAFVLLSAQLYLLDFFSLARGYGLALGFTMFALWQLLRCTEDGVTTARAAGVTIAAGLAVLSNLTFLPAFVALAGALVALVLLQAPSIAPGASSVRRRVIVIFAMAAPVLAWAVPEAFRLRATGGLTWGGSTGFLADVVQTLGDALAYDVPGATRISAAWQLAAVSVPIAAALIVLTDARQRGIRRAAQSPIALLLALGLCLFAMVEVQHALVGTPWPRDRYALAFVPVFLLLTIETLHPMAVRRPVSGALLMAVPAVLLAVQGALGANARSVREWRSEAGIDAVVDTLIARRSRDGQPAPEVRLAVGNDHLMPLRFYQRTRRLVWLTLVKRFGMPATPDVAYALIDPVYRPDPVSPAYTLVFTIPVTGVQLYETRRRDIR